MMKNNGIEVRKVVQTMLYCFFGYIMLRLFWGWLLGQTGIYGSIYSFCVLGFFGIMFLKFFAGICKGGKINKYHFLQLLCIIISFFLLFLGYQYFGSSSRMSNFFGLTLDGQAVFLLNLFVLLFPGLLFCNYCHHGEFKRTTYFLISIVIITNFYFTLKAVAFNPDALRARATLTQFGQEEILFGTPTYSVIYGMAICFPLFLEKIRNSVGKNKLVVLVLTAIALYTVTASQFATAAVAMFFGCFLYLILVSSSGKKTVYLLLLSTFTIIILFTSVGSDFFYWLAGTVNHEGQWAVKLMDIGDSLSLAGASGSVAARNDLYRDSLDAFLANPFVGNLSGEVNTIGGHSTFFDVLGLTGLLGMVPYLLMIWFSYKSARQHLSKAFHPALLSCYITFVLVVVLKNTISSFCIYVSVLLLVPFILKYFDVEIKTDKNLLKQ